MYPVVNHQHHSSSLSSYPSASMSVSGFQGQLLEVTVVGCTKLKDTEWDSRQDPYVCVEYGSNKCRTRTCTDGGKNPLFQEKFAFSLIEGLGELNLAVWSSNSITYDDFIGNVKVQLHKVLVEGFDDSNWPLHTKTGRAAGEVRLILHYANAKKATAGFAPSAPPYAAPVPQVSPYSAPPPAGFTPSALPFAAPVPQVSPYCAPSPAYPTPYAPPAATYPTSSPYLSNPPTSTYPPSAYPPPPQASVYPPPPYQPTPTYPPTPYPSSQVSPYPLGPYPGTYPPPY